MKPTLEQLIFRSVSESNILPITSRCNVKCVFCSNLQNPPGVESFSMPPLDLDMFEQLLPFIDSNKKIVIGEAVTRINEGEPLTHPHVQKIIAELRKKFPGTPIQLTTNGLLLNKKMVELFAAIGNIELNLSLNSYSPGKRKILMNAPQEVDIKAKVELLGKHQVPFTGSVVAMPHLTGWPDLKETICFLQEFEARSTRVFLPGYTRLVRQKTVFEESIWSLVHSFISELRHDLPMPISCEPPVLEDLVAIVEGIFPGSAAHNAGLRLGDKINLINGEQVFSRVDAFSRLKAAGICTVELTRGAENITVCIDKEPGTSPGILLSYDIEPRILHDTIVLAGRRGYNRVLVLTSELGEHVLRQGLGKIPGGQQFTVLGVPNRYFGGAIKSAGLLVIQDLIQVIGRECKEGKFDAVFVPAILFDPWGRDLCGVHYLELTHSSPVPVEVVC